VRWEFKKVYGIDTAEIPQLSRGQLKSQCLQM
jgi:hypothetical protein